MTNAELLGEYLASREINHQAKIGNPMVKGCESERAKEESLRAKILQSMGGSKISDRDQFAMAALTGYLSNPSNEIVEPCELASDCFNVADAMMEARK